MRHDLASAMRRAAELVRAGNPAAATEIIQSSLVGHAGQAPSPSRPQQLKSPRLDQLREKRASGATSARFTGGATPKEPSLPAGARFDHGTFRCTAGSRDYRVYVPNLTSSRPTGLIMMLHGCTQAPVDFAIGTDMNRHGDLHNLIIVYPAQSRGANMQSCWNWFGPADQERGGGEPAILAGLASQLLDAHGIPSGNTYVAGLSAGAAMAVILGQTYPDIFAAVGVHSGLPYKSASDVPSAFATMGGNGAGTAKVVQKPVPTIVFHGTADPTVNASNGQRIADDAGMQGAQVADDGARNGRKYTRMTTLDTKGHATLEYWQIAGLGHAWSGGQAGGSYTDPAGPDASAEMIRFFRNIPVKG